jgi:hypothetical protein
MIVYYYTLIIVGKAVGFRAFVETVLCLKGKVSLKLFKHLMTTQIIRGMLIQTKSVAHENKLNFNKRQNPYF